MLLCLLLHELFYDTKKVTTIIRILINTSIG